MKAIPPPMQADLDAGVTTHARAWRLERADGTVIGLTDHDRLVALAGLTYRPGLELDAALLQQESGLAADEGRIEARLDQHGLTDAELDAGAWDGARVEIFQFDWTRPEHHVRLWRGRLGEIRRGDTGFQVELVGPAAELDRSIGRVYSRRCDAALGDKRCGVAPDHPGFGQGCDKAFSTCRARFANSLNFRGFPYLTGDDALIAPPPAPRDGGSRGLAR
jgi:hypothetical protein